MAGAGVSSAVLWLPRLIRDFVVSEPAAWACFVTTVILMSVFPPANVAGSVMYGVVLGGCWLRQVGVYPSRPRSESR